jgi:hypothetical protein
MNVRNAIDRTSPTWSAVARWAEQRIAQRRKENETPGLPPDETENARGAIEELKLLLKLAEPEPDLSKIAPKGE